MARWFSRRNPERNSALLLLLALLLLPATDYIFAPSLRIAELMRPIFIFAVLGLGLNIITGVTGMLHLGIAAFMAIGAYTYAILTCDIYPFQLGFWGGSMAAIFIAATAGVLLGLPTTRLRGDYLAIVTLGFGEIVQDILRNLESITKGTQGINPLPAPSILSTSIVSDSYYPSYYLYLLFVVVVATLCYNLIPSRSGRAWRAVREDTLAAECMAIKGPIAKLWAFAFGSGIAGLAGALWASYLGSSGEPGNYDFQISIITLCILIVGGMGSVLGVLIGAIIMVGFNSVLLAKLSQWLSESGLVDSSNVFSQPNNWKYMIFGLALIVMMRFRPYGLVPERSLNMSKELKAS